MGPGVDGNLVSLFESTLQNFWAADDAGSNNEKGCLLVFGQQVIVEPLRVLGWTIYPKKKKKR